MEEVRPKVSVVIPTRQRPTLVVRAVRSVLDQSEQDLEIIVIIDGPDQSTVHWLQAIGDKRVKYYELAESVGGAEARNIGVRMSLSDWVAFLDDDDEWLPHKLEVQLSIAHVDTSNQVIIASQYIDRHGTSETTQPTANPKRKQPISEYLFCEVTFKGRRKGFLQTSTWLLPRSLALSVPFSEGLKRNQDTDWLVRAMANPQCELILVKQPLVVFHNDISIPRVSNSLDWQYHRQWLDSRKQYFTSRAAAYFISTIIISTASKQNARFSAFLKLWYSAFRLCPFSMKCHWLCFVSWFLIGRRQSS